MGTSKIGITGGSGYLGSVLVNAAVDAGYFVNVLDNSDSANCSLSDLINEKKINYYQGNLSDEILVGRFVEDIDVIIHLAGVSDGRAGKLNPDLTKKVNIDYFERLIKISKNAGVKKFLFASTMGVYGNEYSIPLTEDLVLKPIDPYSYSKAFGESMLLENQTKNFTPTIFRIAMVYGLSPSMRFDFIVNKFTIDAVNNENITILGGKQKRPQVYIKDVAKVFLKFASIEYKQSSTIYNLVGSNPSVEQILSEVKLVAPNLKVEVGAQRENEDSFEMSGMKLRNEIDFNLQENMIVGIKEIINYYSNKSN